MKQAFVIARTGYPSADDLMYLVGENKYTYLIEEAYMFATYGGAQLAINAIKQEFVTDGCTFNIIEGYDDKSVYSPLKPDMPFIAKLQDDDDDDSDDDSSSSLFSGFFNSDNDNSSDNSNDTGQDSNFDFGGGDGGGAGSSGDW